MLPSTPTDDSPSISPEALQARLAQLESALALYRKIGATATNLHATARQLINLADLNALLESSVTQAAATIDVSQAFLCLIEPDEVTMTVRAGLGAFADQRGQLTHCEQGIVGRVWSSGEPMFFDGAAVRTDCEPFIQRSHCRSLLVLPLTSRDAIVGVLGLAYDEADPRSFNRDDIPPLSTFARMISVVLDNARLYNAARLELAERNRVKQALARRAQEMAALYESSMEINAEPDVSTLLSAIVRRAADLLGARMGGLYLMGPDRQSLELVVSFNLPRNYSGTILKLGEGLSGRVAQTGEPLMISDYHNWEGRASVYEDVPLRRVLGVPLKLRGQVIGVINVTDAQRTGTFDEDEVRLASLFADQAAVAVDKARLYEAAQHELAERKRVEGELRASEARLRAIVSDAPVILFALDPEGVFTLSEGEGLHVLGLKPGEAVGQSAFDLYRDEPAACAAVRRALAGEAFSIVVEGRGLAFETWYSPMRDAQGEVSGVIGVAVDVTTRRRMERVQAATYRISEAAHSAQSLDELFGSIHRIVSGLMPADNFYIALYDAAQDVIGFPYFVDECDEWIPTKKPGRGLTEYVLRTGQALLATPEVFDILLKQGEVQLVGTQSIDWLGVPLKTQNKTIGMLGVQTYRAGVQLSEEDKDILEFVSAQIAMVIERKQAEEALRDSEQRYRRLFDSAQRQARELALLDEVRTALMRELDLPDIFRTVVEATAQTFRYTHVCLFTLEDDSLVLQHQVGYADVIERLPITQGISGRVVRTGRPALVEDVRTDPDFASNRQTFTSEVCVPLFDQGKVAGALNVNSIGDVKLSAADLRLMVTLSEHVGIAIGKARLYDQMRESEERYRRLVELSPDGIGIHCEGKVVYINAAAAKLLHADRPEELIGLPVIQLVHPDYRAVAMERVRLSYENHLPASLLEEKFVTLDGQPIDVEVASTPIVHAGRPATQIIIRDITERKHAEQALHQAQKMESLGILAGGIAHDFNNLLVALLGQTSLALSQLSPEHPAYVPLAKAVKASERAADLTRQLLAYSGRGQFQIRSIDLNALIRDNIHLFNLAVPKHINLSSNLTEPLPLIDGDTGQIQQVIMNLIINAAEAIPSGLGRVMLMTSLRDIHADDHRFWQYTNEPLQPGRYVLLEVQDTGIGMDAATLSKIFDPFFTTKFTGRGLGLAAVLGIVRGHKGGLCVESSEGIGTHFQIVFPASASEPVSESRPETASMSKLPHEHILVIDDEQPVREAVTDILEMEGLKVLTASNGAAGLAKYRERQADIQVVLLDLSMPGLSGEETFHALHAINPNVRVILSSGYSHTEALQRFRDQSPAGFIQKPYDASSLVEQIRRCLD